MRRRVYVAGPISLGDLADNIARAAEVGLTLTRAGYAALVPHLTCYMGGPVPSVLPAGTCVEDWYESSLAWVACADAVLRLPGISVGADMEEAKAHDCNVPVFRDVASLIRGIPPTGD